MLNMGYGHAVKQKPCYTIKHMLYKAIILHNLNLYPLFSEVRWLNQFKILKTKER